MVYAWAKITTDGGVDDVVVFGRCLGPNLNAPSGQ